MKKFDDQKITEIVLLSAIILLSSLFSLIFILDIPSSWKFATKEDCFVSSGENTHSNVNQLLQVNFGANTVQYKIALISIENDFDIQTALNIAECESQFGKYNHNWSGSSAKGIYQFTDKTWENYCEGEVLNEEDNIKCFIKLYNDHPNWWECKK